MPSAHEHFSEQFQKWEKRGRGWQVFAEPVFPEPPFVPFALRSMAETPAVDNGRRPSFLGSLFRKVAVPPLPPADETEDEAEEEPEPQSLVREKLIELKTSLPEDFDTGREAFEQFFRNLALCREPVAFELLGTNGRVSVQFVAGEYDAPLVRRQLQAYFPDASFQSQSGVLSKAWEACGGNEVLVFEFGLEREFMLPLASGKLDPFIGVIGALAELSPADLGLFQVLFQPVQGPWSESIVNSVTGPDGKAFFVNSPELTSAAEAKVSSPLYAVVVRIATKGETFERALQIATDMAASLRVFAHPQGNELIPLNNDEYPDTEHAEDVLLRQCRRPGMLLSSDELIAFVHLPSSAVRTQALARDTGRTKAAPAIVRQPPGIIIGDNEHNGEIVPVFLHANQRVRHTHIIGSNGTGKSSLLLNLIQQDIEHGNGIAVLDPHGDLIDQILEVIPDKRIDDVIVVDLDDEEFPIGFNILQAHSEIEKRLLASDLLAVFRRLSTTWGDQMDTVLMNAILAFLKSSQGGTLADLRRFLRDQKFRNEFLLTVRDPEVRSFWEEVFPTLGKDKSVGSILARLQEFFSREALRNMVSQRENRLDFADIMDSGKIFLAKLSTGLGGEENSYLLGTLLVAKFQQLAMARAAQKQEARRDFWLYIDEFQHFISPSMEKILTGARKYRLGFTLAHQNLHQLQEDANVASAVMTQPCTRIVLRVGDDDAKRLGDGFESFDAKSLTRLEKYHAIVRVEQNDFDFNLALRKPELPDSGGQRKAAIIAASRKRYGTPREKVEADLLAGLRPAAGKTEPKQEGEPSNGGSASKPPPGDPPAPAPDAPQPSEPPHVTEIPKAAVPPTSSEAKPVVSAPGVPQSPRDLGRGGARHKAIQKRIKEAAEALGFRGVIEWPVPGGQDSVDLWLERSGQAIACEISFTTTIDHEVGNVAKCLNAGIPKVAVICLEDERLRKISSAVSGSLGAEEAARVAYFQPDPFIVYLKGLSLPSVSEPSQTEYGGVKVKRSAPKLSASELQQKKEIGYRAMAAAVRPK